MSEPKQVYRLPPCHSFDTAAMEAWLEDMATKGLILAKDSFFGGVATFEKGPPRKIRYRLEATPTPSGLFSNSYDPDDDRIQLYRQMGWQYRGRRGQFFIFASEDPMAPELNTDPQVQAHTIQALAKYQRSQFRTSLFNLIFLTWLHFSDYFFSGMIVLGTFPSLLLFFLFGTDLVRQFITILKLNKWIRLLKDGETPERKSDYANRTTPYFLKRTSRVLLWILAFSLAAYNLFGGKTVIQRDAYPESFPFATLQELYPDAEVTPWDSYRESEVTCWSDFLAPECYEYYESSYVTLPGQPPDTMWLSVLYFDTRWEWTAEILAQELVHQSGASPVHQFFDEMFGDEPIILTELSLEGADYAAYYYKYRNFPYVVVQKGTQVLKANIDIFGDETGFTPEQFAEIMLSSLE